MKKEVKKLVSVNVMVVEDEIIVAKSIQERLDKLGYSTPVIVTSGEDAIKKAGEINPDLVLMDIKLTGDVDGIAAAEQIRHRFDIPVVYLTAYGDSETLQRAKITEPYGYIIKPFEERELQSNIEIALYKHKMENKLKKSKEHLQNIINSTSEIIISFDENNRLSTWNKAAEFVTGYAQNEVIRKHIYKLDVFYKPQEVLDKIKSISNEKRVGFDELILKDKNDAKRIIKVSYSSVRGDKEEGIGVLFVGKDITYERETQGKLISGNSYFISDESDEFSLDLFMNLAKSGYKELLITRANSESMKNKVSTMGIQVVLLKETKLEEFENITDLDALINKIEEFIKNANSLILLERIDYLLTRFSFEKFVETLYRINDIISKNKSILIVHLNPSLLDKRQMTIIENELQPLPNKNIEDIEIEDDLYDILRFVFEQNQNNLMVPYKKIRQKLSIAYSTTSIKLKILEDKDLIFIKKYGRYKTVHVTEKGKILLNKKDKNYIHKLN